jgi:hypothetical protein
MAIRAVGDIIQDYDSDKLFPVLGIVLSLMGFHTTFQEGGGSKKVFILGKVQGGFIDPFFTPCLPKCMRLA